MIKKIIFTISFLQILSYGFSQTPEQNQAKYWYYRYRLINDFMLIGKDRGCSLTADLQIKSFVNLKQICYLYPATQ